MTHQKEEGTSLWEKMKRLGADQMELWAENKIHLRWICPDTVQKEVIAGYAVRIFKAGNLFFASASTTEALWVALQESLQKVWQWEKKFFWLPEPIRKEEKITLPSSSPEDFEKHCTMLQDSRDIPLSAEYHEIHRECFLWNSNGFEDGYTSSRYILKQPSGQKIRKRSFTEILTSPLSGEKKKPVKEIFGINAALFLPQAAVQLISALSSFFLTPSDIPFSPEWDIVDDGTLPTGWGTEPFDGEGSPMQRKYVLLGGEWHTPIQDCFSAQETGSRSTGNCFRPDPLKLPCRDFTNFIVLPSDVILQDFLLDQKKIFVVREILSVTVHSSKFQISSLGEEFSYSEPSSPPLLWEEEWQVSSFLMALQARFSDCFTDGKITSPALFFHW
ncbi:MAG: metallopeptidase TldD-related protein [bacterium JZ-2024 1]